MQCSIRIPELIEYSWRPFKQWYYTESFLPTAFIRAQWRPWPVITFSTCFDPQHQSHYLINLYTSIHSVCTWWRKDFFFGCRVFKRIRRISSYCHDMLIFLCIFEWVLEARLLCCILQLKYLGRKRIIVSAWCIRNKHDVKWFNNSKLEVFLSMENNAVIQIYVTGPEQTSRKVRLVEAMTIPAKQFLPTHANKHPNP